ncbi:MAG: hypothetical protein ABIO70_02255 [Pseudomonadota bacterium]
MRPALLPLLALLPGAARAVEVQAIAACPEVPPPGYRLERAYASGPQDEALNAARVRARQVMAERLCAGVGALRCAAVQRHLTSWGEGTWVASDRRGHGGTACAAVVIEESFLDQLGRDEASFHAQLSALMADLRARAGDALLDITPPTWETGCVVGAVGPAVAGEVRSHLAGARVVPEGQGDRRATEVLTTLGPAAGGVRLNLAIRPPGGALLLLGGFAFPADLFADDPEAQAACRSDHDLGLAGGEKLGDRGLQVGLVVDTHDGVVCPGEVLHPVLMVSQQARVQLYSVARDGGGYLVWPPPGEPGLVGELLDLGEFYAVETPDRGDERLVAVAIPAGSYFGKTEGWAGFCRLPGVFGPVLYPAGAALGTATWRVLPAGMGGCTGAAHPADLSALDAATVCGE